MIKLTDLIAPQFYYLHGALKKKEYTHYKLKGGRGSTKSSFASIEIILGIIKDPEANAVCLMRWKQHMKDSVYSQMMWAVEKLGLSEEFEFYVSPMEIRYKQTGQVIKFKGCDNPHKMKSIKFPKGILKYVWYEEYDQFTGPEEIRVVNQSLLRGHDDFTVFYTYNPPKSSNNWVNFEAKEEREDTIVHHSDYTQVPKEWLGIAFITEAEHLKKHKSLKYRHEYLGEETGTDLEIFKNVKRERITDEQIKTFDNIKRGLDWGYAVDPFAYNALHYDKTRKRIYIFFEIHEMRLSNSAAAKLIKKENKNNALITADSAEPKSISELRELGINIKGAKKGPGSIETGIKWIAEELEEIIIDPVRCPKTLREFEGYEMITDSEGNIKNRFPDENNHHIDDVRYALESDINRRSVNIVFV